MNYPAELKYTKEHEWAKIEENIATMGITDYAQHALTDLVFVELPQVGKKAEQGKPLMVVESVKNVSDVFAPVSGSVIELNKELEKHAEFVNQDPYGKGWMAKIKISNPKELDSLMNAEDYKKFAEGQKH